MGEGIHAGVGCELRRHGERNVQVQNGQIRGQVEIGQGIFDACGIVCNDRERRDFRGGAGGGRNGHENGFPAERRKGKRLLDFIEC